MKKMILLVILRGGMSFQCIDVGVVGDDTHKWQEYQCAQTTAPILPENPRQK